ncbi:MAG: isopentenyl-diphosphate Delta-isomerase [Sulfitobacter sp.]
MSILIPAWVDGTLQPIEKLAAHQRGLRHKAVSVFVTSEDNILIQQRALEKYHTPGLWANTCCTHPEWDETASDCAQRRLNQELGISNLDLHHRGQVEYRADVGADLIEHEVVEVFLGTAPAGLEVAANPQEVMATRWISHQDLARQITETPSQFTPWLRIYLAKHSDMIFGEPATATS